MAVEESESDVRFNAMFDIDGAQSNGVICELNVLIRRSSQVKCLIPISQRAAKAV